MSSEYAPPELSKRSLVWVAPSPSCPTGHCSYGSTWKIKGGGPLSDAQNVLLNHPSFLLAIVPGDGSCFFHCLRATGITDLSVTELRRLSSCDGCRDAEEPHIQFLAKHFQISIAVYPVEVSNPEIHEDFLYIIGNPDHFRIAVVNWTKNGDGLHFDVLDPKDELATLSYAKLREESVRCALPSSLPALVLRTCLRRHRQFPPVLATDAPCPRCSASFSHPYFLAQHKKHCDGRTVPGPDEIVCPFCHSVVVRKRMFQHRQRFHSGLPTGIKDHRSPLPAPPPMTAQPQTLRSLRILQHNIRGFKTHKAELERYLSFTEVHVLCLQETWLTSKDAAALRGYELACRADRVLGAKSSGGGVLIFVSEQVKYDQLVVQLPSGHSADACGVEVQLNGMKTFKILNVYLPPVERGVEVQRSDVRPILDALQFDLLVADINAHHGSWDFEGHEDARGEELFDLCCERNLVTLNTGEPTRFSLLSSTAPDVSICSPTLANYLHWQVAEPLGSDHHPIHIVVPCCRTKTKQRKMKWALKGADWSAYTQLVEDAVSLLSSDVCADVHHAYRCFHEIVLGAAKEYIPRGKGKPLQKAWWNDQVSACLRKRNLLRASLRALRLGDQLPPGATALPQISAEALDAAESECRNAIRDAKQSTWHDYCTSLDQASTAEPFKVLRAMEGSKSSTSARALRTSTGKKVFDDRDKAQYFIKHYAGISSSFTTNAKFERGVKRDVHAMLKTKLTSFAPTITRAELDGALRHLPSGKAAGPDLILPEFLHHLGPRARDHLLKLFNAFLCLGTVPSFLRKATIVPIPKPGKPLTEAEHFRPISLTSVVAKAYERVLSKRLQYYLEGHDTGIPLIPNCQGGFRSARTASDHVGALAQEVYDAFNTSSGRPPVKHRAELLCLDFAKAFDTVWKYGLYHKMCNLGLPIWLVRAVKSTLEYRTARVRYGTEHSKWRLFREGLPQ
eukprot:6490438-Amphidinium_carterae.1